MTKKRLNQKEPEVNFCDAFLDKVSGRQGIGIKTRHLLENFFFEEGWASRTNPKVQKEGYSATLTYTQSTIKHFIEDFTRLFEREWEIEFEKLRKKHGGKGE